jgi:hypothetical protein
MNRPFSIAASLVIFAVTTVQYLAPGPYINPGNGRRYYIPPQHPPSWVLPYGGRPLREPPGRRFVPRWPPIINCYAHPFQCGGPP